MTQRRSRDTGWMMVVGVLVAVVGGAGIAAAALGRPSGRTDDRAQLSAADLGDATALTERTGIPTTTMPADPPPSSAPAATERPATRTAPAPTTIAIGPDVSPSPTTTTTTTPTTAAPTDWMAMTPPRPSPANPPSWNLKENGMTVQLRMTPIAPHVGDTVEFTIESTTMIAGGACCWALLSVGQDSIYQPMPEPGGCAVPPPPARQVHRETRVSYEITGPEVVAVPGPLILNVVLTVSRLDPCQVPFGVSGATLSVPVTVLYPHR